MWKNTITVSFRIRRHNQCNLWCLHGFFPMTPTVGQPGQLSPCSALSTRSAHVTQTQVLSSPSPSLHRKLDNRVFFIFFPYCQAHHCGAFNHLTCIRPLQYFILSFTTYTFFVSNFFLGGLCFVFLFHCPIWESLLGNTHPHTHAHINTPCLPFHSHTVSIVVFLCFFFYVMLYIVNNLTFWKDSNVQFFFPDQQP